MPRLRSPIRDTAFDMWSKSDGEKPLKDIATELGVTDSQIRKWKNIDKWDGRPNSNVTNPKRNVTKRSGAPKENKNAVGNQGGAPVQNSNAVTHGFFRKYFPDEVQDLLHDAESISQIDMLWIAIQTQFAAIVHAQKVMFVRDQDDITQVLTRLKGEKVNDKDGNVVADVIHEQQWEFQYPWDRQANFMSAQSRAIAELRSSIKDFLSLSDDTDMRRLKLLQIQKDVELKQLEIDKLRNPEGDGDVEDDGFIDALKGRGSEVWSDGEPDEEDDSEEET